MSHLVETMAYQNAIPWHGIGNRLPPNQPLEVWLHRAGMNWQIRESSVLYLATQDMEDLCSHDGMKVLYRSDTHAPLSVVSNRYKPVQPIEVLEFYRDLVEGSGFELETAGVLKGGRKLWALAKTGDEIVLAGNDRVKGYLLLATSCDGTLATTAQFTSVRVVCNNTLQIAVSDKSSGIVKVPHSTTFDAQAVKKELGIALPAWDKFMVSIKALSERKVNRFEAMNFLMETLGDSTIGDVTQVEQSQVKSFQVVNDLFNGKGIGSSLAAANGTAWGLVNAVTEYVDHHRRSRNSEYRLDSAWFGQGAAIKQKAMETAMRLVA